MRPRHRRASARTNRHQRRCYKRASSSLPERVQNANPKSRSQQESKAPNSRRCCSAYQPHGRGVVPRFGRVRAHEPVVHKPEKHRCIGWGIKVAEHEPAACIADAPVGMCVLEMVPAGWSSTRMVSLPSSSTRVRQTWIVAPHKSRSDSRPDVHGPAPVPWPARTAGTLEHVKVHRSRCAACCTISAHEHLGIVEQIHTPDLIRELVLCASACVERVHEHGAASHLRLHDRLDLHNERLGY